jgi:hypothetical protein
VAIISSTSHRIGNNIIMEKRLHTMPAFQDVHSFVHPLESRLSYDDYRQVAIDRPWIPVIGIVMYILMMVLGQQMMSQRPAFIVKYFLLAWNSSLAIFSILATIRYTSALIHQHQSHDLHGFFCFNNNDNVTGFWFMLFVYSKLAEFGDTLFLILRKRSIMFLHWYHHITVLLMAWIVFVTKASVGPFFGGVNVFIHSLMYSYYALQTIGIRVPRSFAMMLTLMQMIQMVIGILVVAITHYYLTFSPRGCNSSHIVSTCGSLMYASYLLLFAQFFYKSYFSSKKSKKIE